MDCNNSFIGAENSGALPGGRLTIAFTDLLKKMWSAKEHASVIPAELKVLYLTIL